LSGISQHEKTAHNTAQQVRRNDETGIHIAMSRTRRLVGGLVMTYGYQGLLVLVGFWLMPFYLGHIGQHDYGLWLVGTQLLNYLTLTDFGVVALLPLETAYATGRAGGSAKAEDLPEIVGRSTRIVLFQLPIVVLLAVVMWSVIPANWGDLRGPLAVALLAFVVGFPLRILPALLQGLQDLAFANGLQTVVWILSTASTVAMILAGWRLYALALGWLISQVAMTPLYLYRLKTRFPGVLPSRLPPIVWGAIRTQLGKGFWVSVGQVAQLLMTNTDMLIIGRLLSPAAVVPYSFTGKLPNVLGNQATMLMHTAGPALCELKTGESRQRVIQALSALNQAMLTFSGLVFCVVVVVNHWFVDWWIAARQYGEQYGGIWLTLAILMSMVIRHWTTTTGYAVFCFDHQRRISLTNLCDGLVTAGSCLVCIALWGVIGAPIGIMIGACAVSLPLNLRMIAQDTDTTVPRLVASMLGGWFWRFALLIAGAILVALRWSPKNLVEAAAASVAVAAIYCLFMLPNVLRAPLGNYIRPLITSFHAKFTALQMRFSS
jgi:O-antigen/teichoic acid export membrane protein